MPSSWAKYDMTNGRRIADAKVKPEVAWEYDKITIFVKTYKIRESAGFLEVEVPRVD